jgi:hypothetical protein
MQTRATGVGAHASAATLQQVERRRSRANSHIASADICVAAAALTQRHRLVHSHSPASPATTATRTTTTSAARGYSSSRLTRVVVATRAAIVTTFDDGTRSCVIERQASARSKRVRVYTRHLTWRRRDVVVHSVVARQCRCAVCALCDTSMQPIDPRFD